MVGKGLQRVIFLLVLGFLIGVGCRFSPPPGAAVSGGDPDISQSAQPVSVVLPDGLELEDYCQEVGADEGYLLLPQLHSGGEGAPEEWKMAGSILRFPAESIIWDGGSIARLQSLWNHSGADELGPLEGMTAPAFLIKAEHDFYTAEELGAMEAAGTDLGGVEMNCTYWYIFFARPGDKTGYVLSLDAEKYSREEMLRFAESFQY